MRSRCSQTGPRRRASVSPLDEQTAPLVVSVCRRLDGMPLAIELAAARLRSMSLSELHDRLDQRFRLLTGGSRTALERQQTLRATVDWSYSLLNRRRAGAAARACRCSPSGFDLDAAEAVCGSGDIDVLEVADLLGSLVDKSLVVAEPAGRALRYRLLETIRQFAAERLAEAGEDEAAAVAAGALRAFSGGRRGGGPSPDRARPGQVAGAAGRRSGEPAARRRARGRAARTGPRRCCASASRSTATGWRAPVAGSRRAARAGAAAARRQRRPRAVRGGADHRRARRCIR